MLPAGKYEFLVHDLSDVHNFALGSKTTNARLVETEVEFVGDQTFTLDLPPGSYGYACSPHFEIDERHASRHRRDAAAGHDDHAVGQGHLERRVAQLEHASPPGSLQAHRHRPLA